MTCPTCDKDKVCKDCNKIYREILQATFSTPEEVKEHLKDYEPHQLKKLGREMSVMIYGN